MRVNANTVLCSWTLLAAFGASYAPGITYIVIPIMLPAVNIEHILGSTLACTCRISTLYT